MRRTKFSSKYFSIRRFAQISILGILVILTFGVLRNGSGAKTPAAEASLMPGALDLSFGTSGIVVTDFGSYDATSRAAIQRDGKIVVAGGTNVLANPLFALARYKRDGSLDTTFGGTGKVTTAILDSARAMDVAIQPDGKIVAAGVSGLGYTYNYYSLVRYNTDGSLDGTFGTNGIVAVLIDERGSSVRAVAIQSDNKIVVAGSSFIGSAYEVYTLVRFKPNGTLDPTFGSGGIMTTSFGAMGWPADIAIQPADGKIIAAGFVNNSGNSDFAMARYNSIGSLDQSFGTGGKAVRPFGSLNDGITAIKLQTDGSIVAAGWSRRDTYNNDFAIARFTTNGSYDPTFGSNGRVQVQMSTLNAEGQAVDISRDGKIVVAGQGWVDPQPGSYFGIVRLNSNGTLDTSFDGDGKLTTSIGDGYAFPTDVMIQPDGRVVAIGSASFISDNNFALVRYIGNLRAAADFDGDGRTDISVFRPSDGYWYINGSASGFRAVKWGGSQDQIIPADYDGDGKADLAVWRPSANDAEADFYILNSNGFTYSLYSFGLPGDMPMIGDFDGDGRADIVVYRPSTNIWWIAETSTQSVRTEYFGAPGDVPFVMDNDGDGKSHMSVYRPSDHYWYVAKPMANPAQNFDSVPWGLPDDVCVPADYDGDGKDDVAVFRPNTGIWYIRRSSDGGVTLTQFGMLGDIPVPGDYDGDGRADTAVYRNGAWYLNGSTSGFAAVTFGLSDDRPAPAAYHP